jgi:hypothetical protein
VRRDLPSQVVCLSPTVSLAPSSRDQIVASADVDIPAFPTKWTRVHEVCQVSGLFGASG